MKIYRSFMVDCKKKSVDNEISTRTKQTNKQQTYKAYSMSKLCRAQTLRYMNYINVENSGHIKYA